LGCFIDAHFTHITVATEAQEIIADLSQIIETQVSKAHKREAASAYAQVFYF
jgi:hypothetical protein